MANGKTFQCNFTPLAIGILTLIFLKFSVFEAGGAEVHQYRETTGHASHVFEWHLEQTALPILTITEQGKTVNHHSGPDGSSILWRSLDGEDEIIIHRDGNLLQVTGSRQGTVIQKQLAIDAAPWLQLLSIGLRGFVKDSDAGEISFWMVRPDDLTAHKLKAVKGGTEKISLADQLIEVTRVTVSLHRYPAFLWSNRYWFRKEDGLFIRYAGVNGPPGTAETVVQLINPGAKSIPQGHKFRTSRRAAQLGLNFSAEK